MNENHSQEHDLNKTIDKAIQHQQKSGNDLIDALAQTTPQADSAFQQKLEDNLIAHLQAKKTEEEVYIMAKRKRTNNSRWSLTLAAAVLAIIVIGGFLLMMPYSNPDEVLSNDTSNSFAITATALVERATLQAPDMEAYMERDRTTSRVVIAIQDIALGEIITEEMINIAYLSRDIFRTYSESVFPIVDEVIGKQAQTHIRPFEPVTDDMVGEPVKSCTGICVEVQGNEIAFPVGYSIVTFSTNHVVTQIIPGDKVDVWASIFYTNLGEDGRYYASIGDIEYMDYSSFARPTLVQQPVLENVMLIEVEEKEENFVVMLPVPPDALLLDEFIWESEVSLTLMIVPHVEGSEGLSEPQVIPLPEVADETPTLNCEQGIENCLPEGYTTTVTISVQDDVVRLMNVGERIDVITTEVFATLDTHGDYPSHLMQDGNIFHFASPSVVSQRTVKDAILLSIQKNDNDVLTDVTIGVRREQDANRLTEIAESFLPIFIVPHVQNARVEEDLQFITRGYMLSENNMALVSIPSGQLSSSVELLEQGQVVDISFSLPYEPTLSLHDGSPLNQVETLSDSNPTDKAAQLNLQIDAVNLVFIGDENQAGDNYPTPITHYEFGDSFVTVEVNVAYAWLLDWFIQNGGIFDFQDVVR